MAFILIDHELFLFIFVVCSLYKNYGYILSMEEYLMRMMVCGTTLVESFKSHRTHTKLRQLAISTFYTCAAPNSGPIALLFRKYEFKQLKLPDQLDCSALLYDCRGELIRTIAFDLK